MNNSSQNPPGPTGDNEKGDSAGWHRPKPEIIPPPTYWPFVLSLGATFMGLGILTSNVISVVGGVLFILAISKWLGELASENRR